LAFEKTPWVGTEIPEFIHFDASFEAEDTFDVGEGEAVAL
jgi:hypothetical protein